MSRMLLRVLFVVVVVGCFCTGALAASDFPTAPALKDGKKWRVGYYEGGPYFDYQDNFVAMLHGLKELGWLDYDSVPASACKGEGCDRLWKWLQNSVESEYITFVPDAFYTADWDQSKRQKIKEKLVARLAADQDIDLMFVLGTWAGQDLATDEHSVPCVVMATANPLDAGIIESVEDSGLDHITARIAPRRYHQQIRIFHEVTGFQTLGVAYENTKAGRTYAALGAVEELSEELGFSVVPCFTQSDIEDKAKAEQSVIQCFRELGPKVDAIYVTVQGGVSKKSLPALVDIAIENKTPTFAQNGSSEVSRGLLMSISLAGYKYVGQFYARAVAKVLNGAKPRALEQVFEDPPKIALNLKTAELIDFDPPVDMLLAADEIYETIQK